MIVWGAVSQVWLHSCVPLHVWPMEQVSGTRRSMFMWRHSVSHTSPSVCVPILVMTYGWDFHHAFTFELVSGFLHIQERSCITSSAPTWRLFTAGQLFQGQVHEKEWEDEPKTSAPPEASVKTTAHFRLGQKVRRGKILWFSVKKGRLFFIILWAAQKLCNSKLMPKVRAQMKVLLA